MGERRLCTAEARSSNLLISIVRANKAETNGQKGREKIESLVQETNRAVRRRE